MNEILLDKRDDLLKAVERINKELEKARYEFVRELKIGQKVLYIGKTRTITSLETYKNYPLNIKVILDFECNVSCEAIDSLQLIDEEFTPISFICQICGSKNGRKLKDTDNTVVSIMCQDCIGKDMEETRKMKKSEGVL